MENSSVLNTQAIKLASKGDFPEAIACFRKAIHMDNDNYLLWYNLGVTYRDSGNMEQARQALITARCLNSTDDSVLEALSLVCYMLGRMDEAFHFSTEALNINRNNARTWNNIGVFYFSLNDYKKAAETFEVAVTLNPSYVDALVNLRDTYIEIGNKVGADECSKRLEALHFCDGGAVAQ